MPGGLGAFALVVAAAVIALVLLLVWLLSRDKSVTRTSFGFYVARERFDEETPWPELQPESTEVRPPWPAKGSMPEEAP